MGKDIKNYIEDFKKWLTQDKGRRWEAERKERIRWYAEKLNLQKIDSLTVNDFSKLIKDLWASNIWGNKDFKVQSLIKDNGFEKIKKELKNLLYGSETIEKRWDNFKASIKGLGPSSISEILTFFKPQEFALINKKPYKVFPLLGFKIPIVKDGESYKEAIKSLEKVKNLLIENGIKYADFIITDFFIAYLFYEVFNLPHKHVKKEKGIVDEQAKEESIEKTENIYLDIENLEINSHELAEAVLLSLGNLLGYDTYTPDAGRTINGQKLGDIATLSDLPIFGPQKIMDSAQNIDVIWLKDEWPECFFEVEHSTGVKGGLLRIYQAAEKLSAKFFVIGPEDVLRKFQREIEKSPFNKIKDKYRFRSYERLKDMYIAAKKFKEISEEFL